MSDGTDYHYRERIATHYLTSALYKTRIKILCWLHLFLAIAILIKLLPELLLDYAELKLPLFDPYLDEFYQTTAPSHGVEYVWLCSTLAVILFATSLPRNRIWLLRMAQLLVFVFGMLPVFFAVCVRHAFPFYDLIMSGRAEHVLEVPLPAFLIASPQSPTPSSPGEAGIPGSPILTPSSVLKVPVVLVWFVALSVALQVHGFELYCAWHLARSWGVGARIAAARPKEKKTN